jgi:hypothetical protein
MRLMRGLLAALLLLSLGAPAHAAGQDARHDFGPTPTKGDCRDIRGACIQEPWTGKLTASPHVIREGESVTLTVTLKPGGVSFSLPNDFKNGRECDTQKESRNVEVQDSTGKWVRADRDVATSGTCTIKPGPTNWQWVTPSAGITGPCGSQIAVQEGRAEYAACAGTYASDYYGVISKDEDKYGISGQIVMSDGRGMAGVPVTLSGPDGDSTVTDAGGGYYFLAKKGDYTVSADADVCAEPVDAGCENSRQVSVGPSRTVNFRPRGEGLIEGVVTGPDSRPKSGVTVRIVGKDGTAVTTNGQGYYSARVPKGTYVVSATSVEPPVAPSTTPTTTYYCADNSGAVQKTCTQVLTVDVPPDKKLNWKTEKDPNDLQISLQGGDIVRGETFSITMQITNPRDVALDGVTFADGPGIGLTKVNGSGADPATLTRGPNAPLPTTLAAHQSVTLKYFLTTGDYGDELVNVNAQGNDPDKKVVHGSQSMTVSVKQKEPTKEDLQGLTVEGINDILNLAAENDRKVTAALGNAMNDHLSWKEPSAGDRAAAQAMGLPPEMAGLLAQRRAEQDAFWEGYGEEFKSRVDKFGQSGGQLLSNMYDTLTDPEGRRQLGEKIVDGASSLGRASLENLGYVGDALLDSQTPEGAQAIIDDNTRWAKSAVQALGEVATGVPEVMKQNAEAYNKDPIAYNKAAGKEWGGASFEGVKEASFAALGEVGTKGIQTVAPKALEAIGFKPVTTLAEDLVDASEGIEGADAAATAERRLALAEKANATVQELPYGTVLDDVSLVEKGGLRPTDARAIESIVEDVNKTFGVDFEIGARTSEPLSAGIDGVAKREYIKPKAVSSIDKLLGAEESLAGRASVFEPKMPSKKVLAGLERREPGVTAKIQQRFNDQKKLYDEFQDANSGLKQLIDGSTKLNDKGELLYPKGVTAVVERPGYTFPAELGKVDGKPTFSYLEQLDDPAFLESRGLTQEQAATFKRDIAKYPDSAKTRIITEEKNGTTTFVEGLKNKPIISDLDLEYARPKDGIWPAGKRGQIETFVNARLKKIGRFPEHGWSDAALDVPSDYFEVAAKFKLSTTMPANAQKAANDLVRQFKSMANALRERAYTAPTKALHDALMAKADKFDAVTADYLLKKYPPGEKIIVFSEGAGPTVGSSTGGR